MKFSGRMLQSPRLRFNASLTYATSPNPRDIRRFGPYDSTQFPKDTISCTVVYSQQYEDIKDILIDGLKEGYGFFSGFKQWFRVNINFDEKELTREDSSQIIRTARDIASEGPDFVFIISSRNPENYRTWKSILLGNGIPNQVFTSIYRLKDLQQRPWILANLALSTYAKVGGTPWVIAGDSEKEELVIGVSRAQDATKKYLSTTRNAQENYGTYGKTTY